MPIYIYIGVSVYRPLSVLCVFVCVSVCVISNRSASKKPPVSQLSKLDALLHTQQSPSDIKVRRVDMCRSVISLSKITHQMWHDHPFTQGNKKSSGGGGWRRNGKAVKGWVDNMGSLHKIGARYPLCTMSYPMIKAHVRVRIRG